MSAISHGTLGGVRRSRRQRICKAGTVELHGGVRIACIVRNLSTTGAAIKMDSQIAIADQFLLRIDDDRLVRPCRLIWRKENRVAVIFRVSSRKTEKYPKV